MLVVLSQWGVFVLWIRCIEADIWDSKDSIHFEMLFCLSNRLRKMEDRNFFFYIYGFYIVLTLIVLTPKEAFCGSLNNCYDFRMSVFEEFGFTFLTQSCFFEYVNLYQTFRCINLFWWRLTFDKIEVVLYTSFVYV